MVAGDPIHFVDIRYPLLRTRAAVLARSVGIDDDEERLSKLLEELNGKDINEVGCNSDTKTKLQG